MLIFHYWQLTKNPKKSFFTSSNFKFSEITSLYKKIKLDKIRNIDKLPFYESAIFNISIITIENLKNHYLYKNRLLRVSKYTMFHLFSKFPIRRIARATAKKQSWTPSIMKRTTVARSRWRNPLSYTVHRKFRRD